MDYWRQQAPLLIPKVNSSLNKKLEFNLKLFFKLELKLRLSNHEKIFV